MCPKVSLPREEHQPTLQLLDGISQQLKMIIEKQAGLEQKHYHLSRAIE
jgi:hypothetical protein